MLLNRRRKSEKSSISFMPSAGNGFEMRRAKARRLMNLHNNEAGRRAVYRLVKIECKCHGVSGSCSMKTCWLKLPSFREVGDYLKDKYDASIEVRYESRQNQLRARHRRFSKPTKEDLIYIDDSPNFCAPNSKMDLLGTQGRVCNKNSNGPDGCRIMCCGRGYFIQKTIKEEKCKCKFQWCCSVKCETCVTEVETYICKWDLCVFVVFDFFFVQGFFIVWKFFINVIIKFFQLTGLTFYFKYYMIFILKILLMLYFFSLCCYKCCCCFFKFLCFFTLGIVVFFNCGIIFFSRFLKK